MITVTAVGMVTALGLDWDTSCAASRAGIRRTSLLDHFPFQTAEIGEPQFANGHQVDLITRGLEGFGRLVRLLAGAMKDLRGRIAHHPELLQNAGLYLSIPDPKRVGSTVFGASEDTELELPLKPCDLAARLLVQASQLAQWPSEPKLEAISVAGHGGFAEVLQEAVTDLVSGRAAFCLAGGVDSLLDEDTLTWLVDLDRLKHPANAAGITPGEGCALLLLSSDSRPPAKICAIEGVRLGREPLTLIDEKQAVGAGLWRTAETLISDSLSAGVRPSLTSDHNGEVYRARELGGLLLRLQSRCGSDGEPHVVMPAVSFGDTAAASGAVAVATAAHSFARHYAQADRNVVLSTSDGSTRGAILLASATDGRTNGL